ncbi:MAG: SRPBCC domain-containing protein [Chloroflexota bacterium]
MTEVRTSPPGDRVTVSVQVAADPEAAFRVFTDEIDQWWRRGLRFRVAGMRPGIVHIEPTVGGRLYESFETPSGERIVETGRVIAWEPPRRLAFQWRAVNFAPDEFTSVEVTFEPCGAGTLVTVRHSGWSSIRPDHPARHGLDVAPFIRMMGLWWGDLMTSLREHML